MSSSPVDRDDEVTVGDVLSFRSSTYIVEGFIGEGTFGKVAKCTRVADLKTVAIKMMKKKRYVKSLAKSEVAALRRLKMLDSDKCNIVQWYQAFTDRGCYCLVFEQLDKSLFDFLKERNFNPLLLIEIRTIVHQLASSLDHLQGVGFIHADLKLENVMLVNHRMEPYRIKLIDFGLACYVADASQGSTIQSLSYRSPEIILALPITEAVDMWSLGCLSATLSLGTLLYPGKTEYDMMRYIVKTQGQPPDDLLDNGYKTNCFFRKDPKSTPNQWKLKSPGQFCIETGIEPMEIRKLLLGSLDDIPYAYLASHKIPADRITDMSDLLMFEDMIKEMLQFDAAKRITPYQLLNHSFLSFPEMVSWSPVSRHLKNLCPGPRGRPPSAQTRRIVLPPQSFYPRETDQGS